MGSAVSSVSEGQDAQLAVMRAEKGLRHDGLAWCWASTLRKHCLDRPRKPLWLQLVWGAGGTLTTSPA